jgi:hypothetical protein
MGHDVFPGCIPAASRLAALLGVLTSPVFSRFPPCHPGAALRDPWHDPRGPEMGTAAANNEYEHELAFAWRPDHSRGHAAARSRTNALLQDPATLPRWRDDGIVVGRMAPMAEAPRLLDRVRAEVRTRHYSPADRKGLHALD